MNFEKMIAEFEKKLFLERKYDVSKIVEGETIRLPSTNESITIGHYAKGYLINRPVDTKYEVYIIRKKLRKPFLWIFKRTGEYIGDKQFTEIDQALDWMNETYLKDAKIALDMRDSLSTD